MTPIASKEIAVRMNTGVFLRLVIEEQLKIRSMCLDGTIETVEDFEEKIKG